VAWRSAGLAVLLAILGRTGHASEQAPADAPRLGAHTLLVQAQGLGHSPAVSAPVTTQSRGSSLLVLVGGYASNAEMPADSYGNVWRPVGRGAVYAGYEGRFDARAYVATSVRGGAGHTVSVGKRGSPEGEITMPFLEIAHAGVLQDVAQNYPRPSVTDKAKGWWRRVVAKDQRTSGTVTSGTVTTTGPATLVAVWWGDAFVYAMTAVPDNGFKVVDSLLDLPPQSAVQCAVAVRQVTAAGTYRVSWTGAPAQGAILWLFAFQTAR